MDATMTRWCALAVCVVTTGVVAPAAMQAPAPVPRPASVPGPASTAQQLMQGILFTNANVIFAAEGEDPAAVRRDARPSASVNPLTGLYGGWQAVENSSLALIESADLLDVRGRVCANGTPVPVDETQWKDAVQALRDAARATAAAARARSQPQISAAAETLTESCSSCHRIYRRAGDHCSR
jgi:hypothetical protein